MITSSYLYLFSSFLAVFILLLIYFYFKQNNSLKNNKILLKDLLESFDLELPDELKRLDNSSTDPQKLSQKNYMSKFQFDDTETAGIWWSTNVSIRDLCLELKQDTKCNDKDIIEFLSSITNSIEENGL